MRRIAVILLLALWLPALLHCRLEAAGFALGSECCPEENHATAAPAEDKCAEDACGVAEGEFTSSASSALAAPVPVLCLSFFDPAVLVPPLLVISPPLSGVDETEAAPPELIRTWVFVARAAPSPRAPALR